MKKHTDIYAWMLVFVFGLLFAVNIVFTYLGIYVDRSLLTGGYIVAVIVLAILDTGNLRKSYPDKGVFSIIYIVLLPLYLYRRGRYLDSNQKMLGSWFLVLILGLFSEYYYVNFITDLPSCHNAQTKSTIADMFKNAGYSVVEVKGMKEEGFNKNSEVRVCSGYLVTEKRKSIPITVKINWQDKDKGIFQISQM